MNREEFRKKIVEILDNLSGCVGCEGCKYVEIRKDNFLNLPCRQFKIADALIAAGIGDVKEAEHCTKVFEKALDLCETAYLLAINHKAFEGISLQAMASDFGIHRFFIEQAEKELAEENSNGKG